MVQIEYLMCSNDEFDAGLLTELVDLVLGKVHRRAAHRVLHESESPGASFIKKVATIWNGAQLQVIRGVAMRSLRAGL